jgi:hypothetical protein
MGLKSNFKDPIKTMKKIFFMFKCLNNRRNISKLKAFYRSEIFTKSRVLFFKLDLSQEMTSL